MEIGLIHIYCGDGKGKTTSAVGAAVRCAGGGGSVLFYQFMKGDTSGERRVLSQTRGITLADTYSRSKFVWNMSDDEKETARDFYTAELEKIIKSAAKYDMIVLDEIMSAVKYGFVKEQRLLEFLHTKPSTAEIIMTGRDPSDELIAAADYVSEIRKIKHPFDRGIKARRMIER